MSETITVNDQPRAWNEGSVLQLARELGIAEKKGVALAVNGGVVPRTEWERRGLAPHDRVLVIQATQGG